MARCDRGEVSLLGMYALSRVMAEHEDRWQTGLGKGQDRKGKERKGNGHDKRPLGSDSRFLAREFF